MRLWHESLIPHLPRQQLLGQHRECCALRGAGWNRKHSVVNYVFTYAPDRLVAYHYIVMDEMIRRGYHPDSIWRNPNYRGKTLGNQEGWCHDGEYYIRESIQTSHNEGKLIYPEHNNIYLQECLDNLKSKGIEIKYE